MTTKVKNEWMPIKDVSERTGLSTVKLGRMIKAGRLQFRKNLQDERQKLLNLSEVKRLMDTA